MSTVTTWPNQAENWLDERGKAAWIVAIVLGFIFVWPVGLALLAYMIWSKRMFSGSCRDPRNYKSRRRSHRAAFKSSGNMAFDAYKGDTLRRLEEEQSSFEEFLRRLRESKDKIEFDAFMDDRAKDAGDRGITDADADADKGKDKDSA